MFDTMIPVPVCEFCAAGEVADDDTASVAVAKVTSPNGRSTLTEYVCADHAALLFPLSWQTLSALDPAFFDCNGSKYEVGNCERAVFEMLPIGPPTTDYRACSGCGGCNDCEDSSIRGRRVVSWGDFQSTFPYPGPPAWADFDD